MFTISGSRGFYKAPLSKGLLLVLSGLTVMLTLLPQYQQLFVYNLRAVKNQHQVWRLLCGRLVCLDVKDSFCSSLLIYNFRIFERSFGTRKFASYLFGTWCLSALVDFLLAQSFLFIFDHEVEELPTGLLAPIFSLFVPFYLSIPRIPITQVLGQIHITNKSLVYIVGLQVKGLCGLFYSNVLHLQKFLFVPAWLARIGRCTLEPIFSSSQPTNETPLGMGATLDIQRQQRMDLLDQQLMLAQYNETRRNSRQQHQAGLLQWTRLFPSLRHRGQNRFPTQPHPQVQTQVARLVEMGFSRIDALEALRASNNDINMATNFLLQH
uniref:UBA domain containing 2 n=1 Tax=Cynoglossus semilaevis TaxID=244447 RepID=A0A3P8UWM4_CYNSE